MLEITIPCAPRSKKNHLQLARNPKTGNFFPVQSKAWKEYEKFCIGTKRRPGFLVQWGNIQYDCPVHLKVLYYVDANRKVDLAGLIQGTQDLLQAAGILKDDVLVKSLDGCRIVGKDKNNPRCEITISEEWQVEFDDDDGEID